MAELDADAGVDVVVLTGSDPAFCAGLDLKEAGEGGGVLADLSVVPPRGLFDAMSKPVIGAINGPAATGGLELALTCDFLIASERAAFADTHVRVGILPAGGATVRLTRWIGLPRAKQMSLTGAYVRADQALDWGLVTEVVPHERLLPRALEIAAEIASAPADIVRRLLDVYDQGAAVSEDEAWDIERSAAMAFAAEGGYDPAEIERRRADVITRGRDAQA
jgi:enoyl-CoA hydratase